MPNYDYDPNYVPSDTYLYGCYEATCHDASHASQPWVKRFSFVNGMKLDIGDPLPSGEDPNFDTCGRCKKKTLVISKVPDSLPAPQPEGFWRIPTE